MNFKDRLCSTVVSAVTKNAEHVGENLLPCNAATRLQARAPQETCLPWLNSIACWKTSCGS